MDCRKKPLALGNLLESVLPSESEESGRRVARIPYDEGMEGRPPTQIPRSRSG
jgi:hypothetical protein